MLGCIPMIQVTSGIWTSRYVQTSHPMNIIKIYMKTCVHNNTTTCTLSLSARVRVGYTVHVIVSCAFGVQSVLCTFISGHVSMSSLRRNLSLHCMFKYIIIATGVPCQACTR